MGEQNDIRFPKGNSISNLAKFSVQLAEIPESKKFRIGAGHVKFLRPTCMIYLAKACRQRSRKFPDEQITYSGLNNLSYANNLGFSELLNLKGKPYKKGAFGGQNYIPLSVMSRKDLESVANKKGIQLGDAISLRCDNIAKIVSQHRSAQLGETISRSFREIFRNTFEHGETDFSLFCAQYWPALNRVEICISDRGVGLHSSLQESKYTKPENDEEAIQFALMPGISSKAWRHKKKKSHQKSEWDNSGHGLFFAHQLFGKLGHFYLASGKSSVFLNADSFKIYPCDVEGTLVSMRMDLSNEQLIQDTLAHTADLASKVKQKLGVKSLDIASVSSFLRSGVDT